MWTNLRWYLAICLGNISVKFHNLSNAVLKDAFRDHAFSRMTNTKPLENLAHAMLDYAETVNTPYVQKLIDAVEEEEREFFDQLNDSEKNR